MNILYVTFLLGKKYAGITYSVPNRIKYQSEHDNVFWYNLNDEYVNEDADVHNLKEFPDKKIANLPAPFNHPDLVVFEGFYFHDYIDIARECESGDIPYVIVPRSSLTQAGQKLKKMKKIFANTLKFNRFARNAAAIQYLTEKEFNDSGLKWNKNYFVIPNGYPKPEKVKQTFNRDFKTGTFIGRPDIYHKGIDTLFEAISLSKDEIERANVQFCLHLPETRHDRQTSRGVRKLVQQYELDHCVYLHDGIYGEEKIERLLDSDFFILTSRFEGHPMGLIEALSLGVPALVTEGSNMATEISTHNAGWASAGTPELLSEAIKQLISCNEWENLSKNALKLSEKYDWSKIAQETHEVYKGIVTTNRERKRR